MALALTAQTCDFPGLAGCFVLEGTSRGHLVQPPKLIQVAAYGLGGCSEGTSWLLVCGCHFETPRLRDFLTSKDQELKVIALWQSVMERDF